MWSVAIVLLLLRGAYVLGEEEFKNYEETEAKPYKNLTPEIHNGTEKLNGTENNDAVNFLQAIWMSITDDNSDTKNSIPSSIAESLEGRKYHLKYKRAELQFFMKTFLILKVILSLVLPLGIIASKILSWKAVTLSLMAFMLAKIIFIKNLISGQNILPAAKTNFVPPIFIQSSPGELFWKRQSDVQPNHSWNTS